MSFGLSGIFSVSTLASVSSFGSATFYTGDRYFGSTCDSLSLDNLQQNGIGGHAAIDDIKLGSDISLDMHSKGTGTVNITGTQALTGSYSTTRTIKTATVKSELGTKFGNVSNFETHDVDFEKRDDQNPDAMMVIYYDSARVLEKRGIRLATKRSRGQPSAFPGYKGRKETGCTPPPSWHGPRGRR